MNRFDRSGHAWWALIKGAALFALALASTSPCMARTATPTLLAADAAGPRTAGGDVQGTAAASGASNTSNAAGANDTAAPTNASMTLRDMVPSDWLEARGARAYDQVAAAAARQGKLLADTDPAARQVNDILHRLIPFALKWNERAKNWTWDVDVISSPKIDALSLPGGKFVIYTGMLRKLDWNDDEIAALMGHLMAHALREHARGRIAQQQLALQPAAASPSAASMAVRLDNAGDISAELINIHYAADDETEADVIGADIAARAGYDPRAGLILWRAIKRLERVRPTPQFALAHPVSVKQLNDLQKRQKTALALYAKAIGRPPAKSFTPRRSQPAVAGPGADRNREQQRGKLAPAKTSDG